MAACRLNRIPPAANAALDEPVTVDELLLAVKKVKVNKSPGRDGICQEFFKANWESLKQDMLVIMNQMFVDGIITENQKHGVLVCLPKKLGAANLEDYRPLSLLNTDYKLLARIIANRIRPWMPDIHVLRPSKHCAREGSTILDGVAAMREAVAYAKISNTPLCILSLDFKEFFDDISHTYLFELLRGIPFGQCFRQRMRRMFENTSKIRMNGQRTSPIQISCSVRQGCPMSMLLFAVCLNLLICTLERNLAGIRIGRSGVKTADDLRIFVTKTEEIPIIREALLRYEVGGKSQ